MKQGTKKSMPKESRLKIILAYEFSGQRCFESCDIRTRSIIKKLIPKIAAVYNKARAKSVRSIQNRTLG